MANDDSESMKSKEEGGTDGSGAPAESGYRKEEYAQQKADAQLRRSRWSTAVETFNPVWYVFSLVVA